MSDSVANSPINWPINWIAPQWPAPANVRALTTTRRGGGSAGPYASLNLATHVGDDPEIVRRNRQLLREAAKLPSEPMWLEQVHGTQVWEGGAVESPPMADASIARLRGQVCAILTADCLPVLICDVDGTTVGAAHAGWRGLVSGVLEQTIKAMRAPPSRLMAWLGPAIEPGAFEVGEEVLEQFTQRDARHAHAFQRNERGRWQADLYELARGELANIGVEPVYGGGFGTHADAGRFYSYRREKQTGRMATLVWLE
jgi:YfiH family protein